MPRDAAFIPLSASLGEFQLGLATPKDLPRLLEVELLSQPSPWAGAVFQKEFELDYSWIWVCRDSSNIIWAYLVFWVVHDEVHILNVVTHPDARRKGLARFLVERNLSQAQSAKMTVISLEVRVSNLAAQGLYRSLGFVEIGRRPRYYSDNHEDALILARILEDE